MYKEIILSKIPEYCKLVNIPTRGKTGHCLTIDCPFCGKTATVIPHTPHIKCFSCNDRKYNLIDVARKVENLPDASDEDILTLLRAKLNLNVTTQKDEQAIDVLLNKYVKYGWALVPCAKNGKNPIQKEWQLKENRDKAEWFHWLNSGLNMGVRTGRVSNLCVIDFDFYTKEEKVEIVKGPGDTRLMELKAKKIIPASVKNLLGETLIQETLGGFHVFYQANDLPKGIATIEGVHIDIEAEGGQVVIPPSPQVSVEEEYKDGEDVKKRVVGYGHRKFINDKPIIAMPHALYDILKGTKVKEAPKPKEEQEHDEIVQAIASENFVIKDLEHNRNNTLVTLGGIFRKEMNIATVTKVLNTLNRTLFPQPLPQTEVIQIVSNLDNYIDKDEQNTRREILEYLGDTDLANKGEIEAAVFGRKTTSENKKRLDRILNNLIGERKIIKVNGRNYKLLKRMALSNTITNVGTPIPFKMPYFNDYAYFNKGDIILIGSQTKYGKTTLAMNFVKRLVDQKIEPIYLYNESGGRFAKTALALGLKDGDFQKGRATNPMEVILEQDKVYVYDWIRPVDFAKTADIYDSLVTKLEESNSIMIAFVQLTDKNDWFASNLIRQFVSMSAKYNYTDAHGIQTQFELNDVRDRKGSGKKFQIQCRYVEETREVKTIEELDEEDRLKEKQQ